MIKVVLAFEEQISIDPSSVPPPDSPDQSSPGSTDMSNSQG